ncbi:MAG TPA: response regulator transcription factor [Vicinamibacteria bacterium]|nr:response regulator transcription factor [Vicinamibacteria bacterium]
MATALRLLVVGEDALARAGLRALVEAAGNVVAAEAEPASQDADPASADAAVLDAGPSAAGLEALPRLVPHLPVLVVLWSEEHAREALGAGARGILRREGLPARLAAGLRAVAQGLLVVDPSLAEAVLRPGPPPLSPLAEPLTPRETEVLSLLVEGLSNRAIATRLGISEHTAKFHVGAVLGKLGAQSRSEAVSLAARLGLVVL